MTTRRLRQRLHEHADQDTSALFKHASDTGHCIDFDAATVLASDSNKIGLLIKETLKIKELGAYRSLNRNTGSFDLQLW